MDTPAISPDSRVYVIGASSLTAVKIGVSCNPEARAKQLQAGAGARLEVLWTTPGSNTLETLLHSRFREYRTHGEWFDLTPLGDPVTAVQEAAEELRRRAARRDDPMPVPVAVAPGATYVTRQLSARLASETELRTFGLPEDAVVPVVVYEALQRDEDGTVLAITGTVVRPGHQPPEGWTPPHRPSQ